MDYKFEKIKLFVFDVDGVLTDGGIIYDNERNELKKFNVKDGFIFQPLKEAGIILAAITGRNSPVVKHRLEELKADIHLHGVKEKLGALQQVANECEVDAQQVLYVGDDLPDLACIKWAGIGACPADAPDYIQYEADYVCAKKGGEGVIRELGECIFRAQHRWDEFVRSYF